MIDSNAGSSKRNTSLMKTLFLCQLMSFESPAQPRRRRLSDLAEPIVAIAKEYARSRENTLAVSPDNRSRIEISQAIRAEL
jgi:hypothetical protein